MPVIDLQYKPGTLQEPQQTSSSEMRWSETSLVHFPDADLTPIPTFSESTGSSGSVEPSGTCRAQWAGRLGGSASIQGAYYLFGTHTGLYAEYRSQRYNITPFADQDSLTLGSDPLDTTSGDATLTVTATAHGLSVGDTVTISGASDVGGVTADTNINTTFNIATVPDANSFTVEMAVNASSTASGGGDVVVIRTIGVTDTLNGPFDTISGSAVVTVNYTAHGLATGDRVRFSNANGVGGINHTELNQEHIITKVDDDSFTITVGANALSTASGGGGTDVYINTPTAAGQQNQSFLSGYGAGAYGAGAYGTNRTSTTTPAFPRISSFDNFGNKFLYNPGDYTSGDGQKIYEWDGNRDVAPTALLDAPTNCNWIAVVANQIVALCGTDIIIALTDPATGPQWPDASTSSPIGDIIPVQRSTRLLSAVPFGEKSAIVFAPEPLLLRLVGGVWDLSELGSEYPIAGPAAFCRLDDGVMWYGEDGNYYFCDGGAVQKIVNRQNGEYVRDRLNRNAIWTTFMMNDQKHDQAWHYYPSTGQSNPDSYVVFNPATRSFTTGSQSRTSAQRPVIVDQRFYMVDDETVYSSFTTEPANFSWSAKTHFFYPDPNYVFKITRLYPDTVVSSDVTLKILGKDHPQATEKEYGSYTLNSDSTVMTVRAKARLLALEFTGSSDFTLSGLKMEAKQKGTRRL